MKAIPLTLLVVGALLAGFPPPSTLLAARSAEETVALMIWGLETASRTDRPNTWRVESPHGDRTAFSVFRLSDCVFSASVERHLPRTAHVLQIDYSFDFALVREYSAWFANGKDQRVITKIEGGNLRFRTPRPRQRRDYPNSWSRRGRPCSHPGTRPRTWSPS
jgi:hypothetical protein